ncbi:MAG: hypothetical protein KIT15_00950 [Xanthobacteraceae bacterium]|nr:hypothetical protein [Xanthobacteraceae bacterium]MCW5673122.1 hypothetical protein [Xanthobacteraceae bacterium]
MRKLVLALAAAGFLGLAATATPASAGVSGLTTPSVETNTVQARCYHRRWSSRWRCFRRHHYVQPFYYQPHRWHRHRHWHHRRHHHRHHR